MQTRALDLFHAYHLNKLPREGGTIVVSHLSPIPGYAHFMILAYREIKSVYLSGEGLTFRSDGRKLYLVVESDDFRDKLFEPFRRPSPGNIPHRFSELEIELEKNKRLMLSRHPILTYFAFTIFKPAHQNFAFVFFPGPEMTANLQLFLKQTLTQETGLPAPRAAAISRRTLEKLPGSLAGGK